jgi:hypothetical protein
MSESNNNNVTDNVNVDSGTDTVDDVDNDDTCAKCGICEQRIWSLWNPDPSGWCAKKELHLTCKCSLAQFFILDTERSETVNYMCPSTPKQQMEHFMDTYCCAQAAAVTILPIRARKDIMEAMSGKCGSCLLNLSKDSNGMSGCTSACCPGFSTDCNFTLLQLMDKYNREIILTEAQEDALRALVTQNNTVLESYDSQELFDWDMSDDTTKPKRNRRGMRPPGGRRM